MCHLQLPVTLSRLNIRIFILFLSKLVRNSDRETVIKNNIYILLCFFLLNSVNTRTYSLCLNWHVKALSHQVAFPSRYHGIVKFLKWPWNCRKMQEKKDHLFNEIFDKKRMSRRSDGDRSIFTALPQIVTVFLWSSIWRLTTLSPSVLAVLRVFTSRSSRAQWTDCVRNTFLWRSDISVVSRQQFVFTASVSERRATVRTLRMLKIRTVEWHSWRLYCVQWRCRLGVAPCRGLYCEHLSLTFCIFRYASG